MLRTGFCALVVLVLAPLWLRIIIFGGFGLGGLLILASSLTFQVAPRADHAGIMIRRNAFQPSSVTFYPWEDVDRILIWKYNHIKRLAIQRRSATPRLPAQRVIPERNVDVQLDLSNLPVRLLDRSPT